jgi:hypothetical protein
VTSTNHAWQKAEQVLEIAMKVKCYKRELFSQAILLQVGAEEASLRLDRW